MPSLYKAIKSADIPLILALSRGDVEINSTNKEDSGGIELTPLHFSCQQKKENLNVVEQTLRINADIDKSFKTGTTALHYACEKHHFKTVKLLINAKANIEKAKIRGETALSISSEEGLKMLYMN
eukprot:TRINITY_DN3978_c0_g1_i1.p1 TRINITY_DN3978_c0_g1~~TRINITY_DN3978_c0_g1_i1.p1  ORF type:complete len:125 (-),score=20.18 TRINITY_DN3978_c0_g1_i1:223-597(-)